MINKVFHYCIIIALFLQACRPNIEQQEAVRFNNLAISYAKTNIDSALYYFDKAIAMDSNYLLAYQNKANLLISAAQYKEALVEVNLLSTKTENSETHKMKGLLYSLTNDTIKANESFKLATQTIDEEIKRVNDFLKYQKLFNKGTIQLLLDNKTEGLELINKYSKKVSIPDSRKDSILLFQDNKEELAKILIRP